MIVRSFYHTAAVAAVLGLGPLTVSAIALGDARFEPVAERSEALSEADRFHRLLEIDWDIVLDESPESAIYIGLPGYADRWSDNSPAAREKQRRHIETRLAVVRTIDRLALSSEDQVNYDLFLAQAEEAVAGLMFPEELLPVNQLQGVQQDAASLMMMMSNRSLADLGDQVARLKGLPAVIDQTIALLEEGVAKGVTPPAITLRDVPQQVRNQIFEDPAESPLLVGFKSVPASLPAEDVGILEREAEAVYATEIRPAWTRLETYLRDVYLPAARQDIAANALPNGAAWYAFRVQNLTTTSLTPEAIHDIGLREVARIRAEMEKVKEGTGFSGSLEAFFDYLRTDPKFFHTDATALLAEYRDIAKRIDAQMPKFFGLLPRLPYGVIPVPAYAEKSQTTAYYGPGTLDGGRPGYFYANTYALNTRPRWEMVALTLHEAVPGHHQQLSLAQEIENLPSFRKYSWDYTGFVEGWGLYAESLGEEMGLYDDPYAKFGQLTYEMWRAIRLVVDTGMHAKGWTRQQAIDFFKANASKTENDIVVEIDRYIVWPGQALAYKIGELKIKELRARATAALGARFDLRAFHDEVLRHGAIPLSLLERNIDWWIARQK